MGLTQLCAMRGAVLFICILCTGLSVSAQMAFNPNRFSSTSYSELLPISDSSESNRPKRATIMSAMLPGLGQIYNQKYWKVGVLYTAGFAMGYGMKYNTDSLKRYQKALTARVDLDTATKDVWYPNLTDAKVNGERDYYRKNRDMLIIGFFALYTLQIIDANVDAHLREFEVNKDLALRITPDFRYTSFRTVQPGLTLALRLK